LLSGFPPFSDSHVSLYFSAISGLEITMKQYSSIIVDGSNKSYIIKAKAVSKIKSKVKKNKSIKPKFKFNYHPDQIFTPISDRIPGAQFAYWYELYEEDSRKCTCFSCRYTWRGGLRIIQGRHELRPDLVSGLGLELGVAA
jgi:hypothetical protein